MLAVGLHPRVRSGAAGRHYTSTGTLPMIPGVDGVGRLPDGGLVYFAVPDDVWGSMAEQAVVDPRRTVPLPDDADVAKVAAAMNPAMSAWVALRRRVPLEPGQSVLVLGATGNAGTMAVQVARRLGAGRVVGAGRNPERLAALAAVGADEVVALDDDAEGTAARLAQAAAEVRHRDRLPVGRACRRRHDGPAHRPGRPQPGAGLDPDRRHRRTRHRASLGRPALGQPADSGLRAGRR